MPSPRLGVLSLVLVSSAAPSFAAIANEKPLAAGDKVIVTLMNGSEIKGVYRGDADGAFWVESNGAEAGLEPGSIAQVSLERTPEMEYREKSAVLGEKDAGGWWRLSQWAAKNGLKPAANDAAKTVLKINPAHKAARAFLGYEMMGGRWLDRDAAQISRGLTLYDGEWLTPPELAERRKEGGARSLLEKMHANDPVIRPPVEVAEPEEPRQHPGRRRPVRKVYLAEPQVSSPKPSAGRVDYYGSGD